MSETNGEGVSESAEGMTEREIMVSGTVVDNAIKQLRDVDSSYSLKGVNQDRLDQDIFSLARRAGKAENRDEEKRLLQEADALGKIRDMTRPNNSITDVSPEGMTVRIKEFNQNP